MQRNCQSAQDFKKDNRYRSAMDMACSNCGSAVWENGRLRCKNPSHTGFNTLQGNVCDAWLQNDIQKRLEE